MKAFSRFYHGVLIGVAAGAVALALYGTGVLQPFESVTWDWRVRALARPAVGTSEIALVFLDQGSLDWGKETMGLAWPWPREVYAPIINFCKDSGARALAFDVLFSEPSVYGVADDAVLGAAIAASPGFVGSVFLGQEQGDAVAWPEGARDRGYAADGAAILPVRTQAAFPVADVFTNAPWLGAVSSTAETEAAIRRMAPAIRFDGRVMPTLGVAAYLAGNPGAELTVSGDTMTVGGRKIPLDTTGHTILRFRGPTQTHATVSAHAVIQSYLRQQEGARGVVDPAMFKDRYVLFGFTAPGLKDLRPTPVGAVYPGVEVHATLLDNLLTGDAPRDAPGWATGMLIMLGCLAAGIVGRRCGKAWQVVLAMAVTLPTPFCIGLAGYVGGWWIPVAAPMTGFGLALVGAVVVNYAVEGRQKRFIKGAFKQYLSPHVIEALLSNPDRLQLGGELRELSIFFSDIQGFTGISEKLEPEGLTTLLNEYLTAMTDIILDSGGTIDKYEGDAIIAFWNAPLEVTDHPARAVKAALACQAALDALRPGFQERYGSDVRARIGIHTGPVVVGNMGSSQRFDYTFLGDAGNLASRLEGINKQFGTFIMISEVTARRLPAEWPLREISRVRVVGRAEPVRVFEPWSLAAEATRKATLFDPFAAALEAYYAGDFRMALSRFEALAKADPVSEHYAARCRALIETPPAEWDGVWTMDTK